MNYHKQFQLEAEENEVRHKLYKYSKNTSNFWLFVLMSLQMLLSRRS
jgi:hypothetical protein